ncbi:MAG: DUF819 family protein [Pelagimonas sp.]|jgi:uncharacterized membrane protein|nr:DUF819 family protein [Pelagimonas sp.]
MNAVVAALICLAVPGVLVLLSSRVPVAQKLGPIVLCYLVGMGAGMSGVLPESAAPTRSTLTEASLALALPLLLFSVDVAAWRRMAGSALLSMGLAVVSVVALTTALFHIYLAWGVAQPEQLSAMAIGMYTGGIANLGAIKLALAIPDTRYLLFATVDTLVGAVYLLFVLTHAARVFGGFLPAFVEKEVVQTPKPSTAEQPTRPIWTEGAIAVLAAAACVGGAVVCAPVFSFAPTEIAVITLLTSFGLAGSFFPMLRHNRAASEIGMYLIYVFTFCVAASLDLGALRDLDLSILLYILIALFGSLALHALLCRLFRIDTDTFLITSVAAIMSPAFVPMVARSLKNPTVLMSGMATGILGFAIGNYLGIAVALLLS